MVKVSYLGASETGQPEKIMNTGKQMIMIKTVYLFLGPWPSIKNIIPYWILSQIGCVGSLVRLGSVIMTRVVCTHK